MRDINITILSNGTAQIDEPSCFCGEHNAARLCITLSSELKTDASYYLLSFSSDGMSRRIVSNTIKDSASTPANVINGVIYCPLPEELTEMEISVFRSRRTGLRTTRSRALCARPCLRSVLKPLLWAAAASWRKAAAWCRSLRG